MCKATTVLARTHTATIITAMMAVPGTTNLIPRQAKITVRIGPDLQPPIRITITGKVITAGGINRIQKSWSRPAMKAGMSNPRFSVFIITISNLQFRSVWLV